MLWQCNLLVLLAELVQGYALVEYKTRDEAEAALEGMDRSSFLEREIRATWAFVKPPRGRPAGRRR